MKGILRKEVRPITFDKIIIELEAEERDILLEILDKTIEYDMDKREEEVFSKFKKSLTEPELVKEPEKKPATPNMKTDDLNPTDPKFKTKVLERLMQSFLIPNVKGVGQWKAAAINLVTMKRKEITARPKSMNDEAFFDWLVEVGIIDAAGKPIDQTKTTKEGPVKK